MKRWFAILIFILSVLCGHTQNITVQRFFMDERDLTANTTGTLELDQNGQKCALVKIETTQTGFSFDVGSLGVVKTKQMVGEIWLYVPEGVKRITISHQQFGVLRDYDLGLTLKRAKTYIMRLSTNGTQNALSPVRTSQYVVFQLTPPNAIVELDGELLQSEGGTASKLVRFGTYNYRVNAANYLPEVGKVTIDDPNNKKIVEISLKPNLSQVTLTVDGDAEIWVNGEKKGIGSWTGTLGAGTYEFETRRAHHRSAIETRDILSGSTSQTIRLKAPTPIYGEADINSSPAMADIYIDGEKVGQTPQILSRLYVGEHNLQLSKEGYSDYIDIISIQEGKTFQLSPTLEPISSQISISSNNPKATLYIDDKDYGRASGKKNIASGIHTVRLTAEGWEDYTGTINVTDKQNRFHFSMKESKPKELSQTTLKGIVFDLTEKKNKEIKIGKVAFNMIYIEGGTFLMGSEDEEMPGWEKPVHSVTLSSYYLGETEVTQELWNSIMKKENNPSELKGDKQPVNNCSWDECQEFISKLNQRTGLNFRLPTEAEWEYAACGGEKSNGYIYSGSSILRDMAWFEQNTTKQHEVKTKSPNELGLYDMSGNVCEWCNDRYGTYSSAPQENPKGADVGEERVIRGGSWAHEAIYCRNKSRLSGLPTDKIPIIGLRLAL